MLFFLDEVVHVRRKYYPPASPAGKGAKWECAIDHGQEWQVFDMDTQCLIEEAWAKVSCCLTPTEVFSHPRVQYSCYSPFWNYDRWQTINSNIYYMQSFLLVPHHKHRGKL